MIHSMTAFARCDAHHGNTTLIWEVKSVNQRYLDLHFRLPEGFKFLDNAVREQCRQHLNRGKLELTLRYQQDESEQSLSLNQELVSQLQNILAQLADSLPHAAPANLADILKHPGVLQQQELDFSSLQAPVLALLQQALTELNAARAREGAAMAAAIRERLTGITTQIAIIEAALPDIQAAQQQRLRERVADAVANIDSDRIEQELVLLANRMDVAEEIDRLKTHQQEAERILTKGGAVGRRLDFLMQEFNREANTLASKSIDATTTAAAVELKVLIEQMREQVQNIE